MLAPLPISSQAVQEVLLSHGEMPATDLAAMFAPADDQERKRLVHALSSIADMLPPSAPGGQAIVRLKARSGAAPTGFMTPRGAPLPIEAISVRALLLAQPRQEMAVAELRERFAPPADETERQALVSAISEVAEVVPAPSGPIVRLLPSEQRPPRPVSASAAFEEAASMASGHQPITPIERELVRKVLAAKPNGAIKPAELVKMLAPNDPAAKRRLARVLSEVATVTAHADGSQALVLRDTTNLDDASEAGSEQPSARRRRPSRSGSQFGSVSGGSALSEASTRSQSLRAPSWAASNAAPPVAPVPEDVEPPPPPPTLVSDELVLNVLRAQGGRLPSRELIDRLSPLDKAGQRALASFVQRLCDF